MRFGRKGSEKNNGNSFIFAAHVFTSPLGISESQRNTAIEGTDNNIRFINIIT